MKQPESGLTLGDMEHLGAIALGCVLAGVGLNRRSRAGLLLAAVGAGFVARGLQGYAPAYRLAGRTLPQKPVHLPPRAATVRSAIRIERPSDELYLAWRDLARLPEIITHLVSVRELDGTRSHWVAKGPAGTIVEWDARIINEEPGRLIAWQSLDGSDVDTSGSVHFDPTEDGATIVRVTLRYLPPGDVVGAAVGRLLGVSPERRLDDDLAAFKARMEAGVLS